MIVSDNGTETDFERGAGVVGRDARRVALYRAGKPTQNGFVEELQRSHARRAAQ